MVAVKCLVQQIARRKHKININLKKYQIWFPWCVCPEVGLLGHMEVLFPVF